MFSAIYPVKILPRVVALVLVLPSYGAAAAGFHHVHLLASDPLATVRFYCARVPCKNEATLDQPGFDTGRGLVLISRASQIRLARTAFWHLGWGFPDIRAEYIRQLDLGTAFSHPLEYLHSDLFYAYVRAPHGVEVELMPSQTEGFAHIHLYSAHPAVAGEWYVRFLGLRATRPLESKPVTIGRYTLSSMAALDAGGVSLTIFPKPEDVDELASTDGTGMDHLGFRVDSLDQKLLELRQSGARILSMPRETRPGERSAFVQGPDRMKIELMEFGAR
jgi:catechol 2,3-dioxygenase-like lactoylglutathione lyase family enzyme